MNGAVFNKIYRRPGRGSRPSRILRKIGCRKMYEFCRVNPENSDKLIEEIKRFAVRLKEILPVKEVYLFCSFAKGEIHEGSDIDLLIIGQFEKRLFDRIGKILDLTDLSVEPFVYKEKGLMD